jgi:uncharacterized membrane protein YheB (UPF0754 family)
MKAHIPLTSKQRHAVLNEIKNQIVEHDEKHSENIDALVLYTLYAHYGWHKKRLKRFWNAFIAEHKALREHYQMYGVGDNTWLAHRKLKDIGVDIKEWYEEMEDDLVVIANEVE